MIKTPLSTVIGGAFWTPSCTVIGGQQSFSQLIKKLFANGEQGFFYDTNDLSTMFQDAAGTVPVTAVGQPVGLVKDKSGRNNHAYQTNAASRPLLQRNATTGAYYLAFDGTDDFLVTNSINFTGTDKVSLFAGVRKLSDVASAALVELSANSGANNGVFALWSPLTALPNYACFSRGTLTSSSVTPSNYPSPNSAVLSAKYSISQDVNALRVNSIQAIQNPADQGTGNYGNYPLYIGRRGGTALPFNGHIYSLIGIGRLTTDSETIALEKSIAKNTGVTLSV